MALTQRDQVAEQAYVRLPPGLWGKPRFASLFRSFLRECQRTEDEAWELFACADLATAPEWALTLLGKLIGQARHGLDLEQFRLAIQARALANRSSGLLSDLFQVLNLVLGSVDYTIIESGNASLQITALDPLAESDVQVVAEVLPFARAGGVGLNFYYSTEDAFVWGEAWGEDPWGTVRSM